MEAEQGLISFTNPKPIHVIPTLYIFTHLYFSRQIGDGDANAGVDISVFHPSRQDTTYSARNCYNVMAERNAGDAEIVGGRGGRF